MNLLIFSANWYNRGDESAIRAMIDEIRIVFPDSHIKIHFNQPVKEIPYDDIEILNPFIRCAGRNIFKNIFYNLALRTNGKIPYIGADAANFRAFVDAVKWADYAIYAPGGPCIGDYYNVRRLLLDIIEMILRNGVPYSLFAPSVGPFSVDEKRVKYLIDQAKVVCFRESISQGYYAALSPEKKTTVTLDSAFQHEIDLKENRSKLDGYKELSDFLKKSEKVIGITVTDLKWHRKYRESDINITIANTFHEFLQYIEEKGYSVLFIPQLFGANNDAEYMSSFAGNNSFVMSNRYDCYFQQFVISQLYAVVGMRYHSNIFSAKMGTPFVSVAYEQKMQGFMEKVGLAEYCLDIHSLSFDSLKTVFDKMTKNYDSYKEMLDREKDTFRQMSYSTTQMIVESILDEVR